VSTVAIEFYPDDLETDVEIPPEPTPEELSAEAIEFIRQGNLPPVLPLGLVTYPRPAPNGALALQNAIEMAWHSSKAENDAQGPEQDDADEAPADTLADLDDDAADSGSEPDEQDKAPTDVGNRPVVNEEQKIIPEHFYSSRHDVASDLALLARAAMVVVVMIMVVAFARTATAAEDNSPDPGLIAVSGIGKVTAAPDLATITTGVVTSAPTAREAVQANTQAMTGVLNRLKGMGIEDRDLQTSGFSINPQYQHFRSQEGQPARPPKIVAYEVRNTLTVRIRDLDATGAILDAVVSDGANQMNGISFSIDDPTALMQDARKRAVSDARLRAELLAESLGVSLGRIVSVSEGQVRPPIPQPRMARMDMAMAAEAAPVPVEAGEQSLTATVSITWEIDQ
jgi:uncharacterized protein YggE